MDSELRWENNAHTVIRLSFRGDWNWTDFYAAIEQPDLANQDVTICLIVDLRAVNRIPSDAVLHLKRAAQLIEQVKGAVILIATSNAALTTYQLMITVYKPLAGKIQLVSTDQEAYALLQMPAP
ncbi:MAG TPA: hypothetical protein VHD90_26185 [Phototrophicaceae bacterium]|nr:hypothetical protein [Phototrophicaceae bacterium]